MRQVPHYLIIGNGRVAKHFQYYFSLLNLSFSTWSRQHPASLLQTELTQATHILLLINDDAIQSFIDNHLRETNAMLIHFSGSLSIDGAVGAHPLMTFSHDLYDLETYRAIPFIVEEEAPAFNELLPGLQNRSAKIARQMKAKYHAMCVLSGNVSCFLWQQFFSFLLSELKLPREVAFPYLQQQMNNLIQHPDSALTGPMVRNDQKTIEKHLAALTGDGLQAVYQSVVDCYRSKQNEVV